MVRNYEGHLSAEGLGDTIVNCIHPIIVRAWKRTLSALWSAENNPAKSPSDA